MLHDDARAVRNTGKHFCAFVTYFENCALVQIYDRPTPITIDFSYEVAEYETARKGACASARREINRLSKGMK